MLTYFLRGKGKYFVTEDILTGSLGDILDWWSTSDLIERIVKGAVVVKKPGEATLYSTELPHFEEYKVELWPWWDADGIPDIAVKLLCSKKMVGYLVIEAKFGAKKSGTDALAASMPMIRTQDQLARYYRYAASLGEGVWVLYLTHHASAPREELDESLIAIQREHPTHTPSLMWCSWRDVEQELRFQVNKSTDISFTKAVNAFADLLRLHGMYHFSGNWPTSEHEEESGLFFSL